MILREKQSFIPLLAMTVLLIASASTIYVYANQPQQSVNTDSIIINDQTLNVQTLFQTFSNTTIETNDGEKTGISISEILLSTGLDCPTCYSYTIIASDGYKQTVKWNDVQQGIITLEKRSYFPHLAHAFWIRDIVEIEVK